MLGFFWRVGEKLECYYYDIIRSYSYTIFFGSEKRCVVILVCGVSYSYTSSLPIFLNFRNPSKSFFVDFVWVGAWVVFEGPIQPEL